MRSTYKQRATSPRVSEMVRESCGTLPVWIRAPKNGVEHFTGFTRTKLYLLVAQGKIRSVSIREPGQVKGTRLFHLQSILDYIATCEAPPERHALRMVVNGETV